MINIFNISIPSNLPGNINFITGSAKKNNPKVHGIAITDAIFIDASILPFSSFCFLSIKFSAMIGIRDVQIAIERVNGIFTITDAFSCLVAHIIQLIEHL
ncbi:hypothetical protein DFM89_005448 [Clostridium beijerinckii]|nr:hypothetical protein [Clostridium beijerinckii]